MPLQNTHFYTVCSIAIGSKEVSYQASKASNATASVTGTISSKAASLRARYEADLADRKAGIKKVAPVVTETPVAATDATVEIGAAI